MPYPKKNLNPNETLALDMHPHWWYFSEPAAALVASIMLAIVVLTRDLSGNTEKILNFVVLGLLIVSALWLVGRYLKWITTNFAITSHRLIFRQGVVAKSGIEIPLERVNNVNFSQSVFERVLGAGDLLIESGGEEGQSRFTDIRHPDRVQNLIHSQVAALQDRRLGTTLGAASDGDVTAQLERLEGMLQRGTLTQAEFDAQKAKLLG
jgi:uncharacterized membrane protein YdbT with pleckstrin-like domain